MDFCANCSNIAVFDYLGTKFCEGHLPRFLTKPDVAIKATRIVTPVPETFSSPEPQFATDPEPEAVEEVEDTTKPKSKAKPKAEEAPEGE
jgi:hypothetical protein